MPYRRVSPSRRDVDAGRIDRDKAPATGRARTFEGPPPLLLAAAGLVLDSIARGRLEAKRLAYLAIATTD